MGQLRNQIGGHYVVLVVLFADRLSGRARQVSIWSIAHSVSWWFIVHGIYGTIYYI